MGHTESVALSMNACAWDRVCDKGIKVIIVIVIIGKGDNAQLLPSYSNHHVIVQKYIY